MNKTDIIFPDNKFLILIILSLLAGILIGWIDSSPLWNDTGITAGLILISSFIIGLLTKRKAWIPALITGLSITSLNFIASNRLDSAISILFSLAGAYSGVSLKFLLKRNKF
jgi:hypothetical protein